MVHCPRWSVGKNPDGTTRFKCSDDSVFHRDLMRLLWTRPQLRQFVLAGADTDSLASACLAEQQDKEVVALHNSEDGSLGHVMRMGNFQFRELPMAGAAIRSTIPEESADHKNKVAFGKLPTILVDQAHRDHNSNGVK